MTDDALLERPAVLVVVVNYGTHEYLAALLESLAAEPVGEIVVWDNMFSLSERDDLAHLMRGRQNAWLQTCEKNVGFAAGVNGAVRMARNQHWDYLWILNPDVTVRAGTLAELTRVSDAAAADIVSPTILGPGSDRVWFSGGEIDLAAGRSIHAGHGDRYRMAREDFRDAGFITGAAPLITRRAWNLLGGFDERYFLYCEDADLSIRAAKRSLRMVVSTRAIVEHNEGGASGGEGAHSATFYYYVQRNRLVLYSQHTSRWNLVFGRGIVETARLTLLTFRPLRGGWHRLCASLSGLRDGVRGVEGPRRSCCSRTRGRRL